MKRNLHLLLLSALAVSAIPASAQIPISAGTYTQNFDTLANTGTANSWVEGTTLPGWYASTNKAAAGPTGPVTVYRAGTGSETTGALYSFGSASSSDRALGDIGSGTPGAFAYGVRFKNDTAETITDIKVSYIGEQWRNGGNSTQATQTNGFSCTVSDSAVTSSDAAGNAFAWTSFTALDFISPVTNTTAGALDGNAAANRVIFSSVPLTGVQVLPGQELFLRWFNPNDAGNDHGLAVDDLVVTFGNAVVVTNPPAIDAAGQPASRTNNAGTIATFMVTATGTAPLYYEWRKDGYTMYDGGNIWGTTSSILTLTNVSTFDVGSYTVVITNVAGSITSQVATLTVIDPAILTQPSSRTNYVGDTITLSITAAGSPVMGYQWYFNNEPISWGWFNSLTLTNLTADNQGDYYCVVVNGLLVSATSQVARVTVLTPPANILAKWDFSDTNAPTTSPPPALGNGTAALLGGVTATFLTGSPSDTALTNASWGTATYPAQGTAERTAGVQFNVPTTGRNNIVISWQERHSNTASKYQRFQYTSDGSTWTDGPGLTYTVTDNSYVLFSVDLSTVPAVNNSASFAFRVVTEFESSALSNANQNYVGTTSYGTAGTIRYDLVTVYGDPSSQPSPAPIAFGRANGSLVLTWANSAFSLAASTNVLGPYEKVVGATSPYTNSATVGGSQFFRLVWP